MKDIQRQLQLETAPSVDVEGVILSSLDVAAECLSLTDAFEQSKMRRSYEMHVKELIDRVGMHRMTLRFLPQYEAVFARMLHRAALRRIRYTLLLGCISLVGKTLYTQCNGTPAPASVVWIGTGFALSALAIAFGCTYREAWTGYCELYTSFAFVVVAAELTVQKLLLHHPGPILELFVCFIPIFGITRLRFDVAWRVVAATISTHLIALLAAGQETVPDIGFQAFSYLGGIVGGAVAHYRVEVLRRRNYTLHLPFYPRELYRYEIFSQCKAPATSKHALLHPLTLQFKHPAIEATFYRHWYLLDGSPFEPLDNRRLHKHAFHAIRYAVQSVLFQQLLLAIQDRQSFLSSEHAHSKTSRRYLMVPDTPLWPYHAALALRMTVVAAYFGAQACMHRLGRAYYETSALTGSPALLEDAPALLEAPPRTYVHRMQQLSTGIVFGHVLSMGSILLFCTLSSIAQPVAAPCYYLGLLNAILFPHRSGLRVRFVYATAGTVAAAVVFVGVCTVVAPTHVHEYGAFVAIVLVLGMLTSYEEEALRRSFFVRRSLRTHDFFQWHRAVRRLVPFVRRRLARTRGLPRLQVTPLTSTILGPTKIPTCNLLAKASRCGMYWDICQVGVAVVLLVAATSQ
ncbi:hypothetical protein SPRG_20397 [Saprolegnia parasitica CBS 223.65]|uniref:Uncharacterized protein n=1 Tax=Saprolegnia parasitica (strain CBS 223.65) TaxID=695850 RepID=A0A067CAI5_SAPPC|nr:hypothetical protein SPRG_20397 [Saprolegnia parasitica CBS 223.65]KDO27759.1 hypothetical protein SPRG_20397 [Saprolegnia parasitica CBS 223.65]|eukprot:XP_012201627.1 hypothetical protein SPRG_20397 [Saprolegnia parasitica CBS 223.65]